MRIYDKLAELWILRLETRTSKAENAKNGFSDIVPNRMELKAEKFEPTLRSIILLLMWMALFAHIL